VKGGHGVKEGEGAARPGRFRDMGYASFHIHLDVGQGAWVVEEEASRQIGGIFATLLAALQFAAGESRRFQRARTVVELSPRVTRSI
jgi:hypothetical protein